MKDKKLMNLLASSLEPKISIILPIHPETPQIEDNILTYKNLLKDTKKDLELNYPRREWNQAVEKLEALLMDRTLWNNSKKALLIFANNEDMIIKEMEHTVLAKQHVGNTYLVQDLLLPEENTTAPQYLINLSRDRINIFDMNTLKEVKIDGLYTRFSDYYADFDANSNLNSRTIGRMNTAYHGHRAKSEEQQKDQAIYYRYLDRELNDLHKSRGMGFIISGLPEVLDVYLSSYGGRDYLEGVLRSSILNMSKKELADKIKELYSFERLANIEKVKQDVEIAEGKNRILRDLDRIDLALTTKNVKSLISFNDGRSYSVEHNKLLLKSLLNKVYCRVLYTPGDRSVPSMNAILY